jgi:hypothetical protein
MRSAATSVNYVYNIKITQKFRQLSIPLIVIFLLAASEQPTITRVAIFHTELEAHVLEKSRTAYIYAYVYMHIYIYIWVIYVRIGNNQ